VVKRLRKGVHYEADEKQNQIVVTDEGMEAVERGLGVDDLYTDENIGIVHMVEQSLRAQEFFRKDKEYMVRDGEVFIVDEFTGRVMEGRRYSNGLHQALEAKEGVALRFESQTVASITYQNYFRLYKKLSGMTGTAMTESAEFAKIYNLEVYQIPTNLPLIREDLNDLVFATEKGKFKYLVNELERVRGDGRPILVGTVSIEKSELMAKALDDAGITEYQVLRASWATRASRARLPLLPTWPAAARTLSWRKGCVKKAACTSWARSATNRGASTTSFAAAADVRATPAPRAST
jgi:preprotein translocase subunit SecA